MLGNSGVPCLYSLFILIRTTNNNKWKEQRNIGQQRTTNIQQWYLNIITNISTYIYKIVNYVLPILLHRFLLLIALSYLVCMMARWLKGEVGGLGDIGNLCCNYHYYATINQ